MVINRVVARFKDGSVIKGTTSNFSIQNKFFHLESAGGKKVKVSMEELKTVEINQQDLKAAFFVRDFDGNKDRVDKYDDIIAGGGKKVRVKFIDGEVIVGYTLSYDPNRFGFLLTPADVRGNNERIFVIRSSVEEISFPDAPGPSQSKSR